PSSHLHVPSPPLLPCMPLRNASFSSFFSNPTPTPQIYTLSLHDALPISVAVLTAGTIAWLRYRRRPWQESAAMLWALVGSECAGDRKSTRLNSSHQIISYAVFCLKKKKNTHKNTNARSMLELQPAHDKPL